MWPSSGGPPEPGLRGPGRGSRRPFMMGVRWMRRAGKSVRRGSPWPFTAGAGPRPSSWSRQAPSPRPPGHPIERLGGAYVDAADPTCGTRYRGAFDFILSTLNVPFDLDFFVSLLKPDGQLCLLAAPLTKLALSGGLLNDSLRSIKGNYIGSRADTSRMLQFAAEHGIAATVEVMPFTRINEAIARVRNREVPMGLVLEYRE